MVWECRERGGVLTVSVDSAAPVAGVLAVLAETEPDNLLCSLAVYPARPAAPLSSSLADEGFENVRHCRLRCPA